MENNEQKIYKLNGKEYVLSPEVVQGGCQGCAFYDRLDCHKKLTQHGELTRAQLCNKHHMIFKRLYNHH